MKKTLAAICVLLSLPSIAEIVQIKREKVFAPGPVIEVTKTEKSLQFQFSIQEFEVNEKQAFSPLAAKFDILSFKGLEMSKTAGEASLPYKSFLLKGNAADIKKALELDLGEGHSFIEYYPSPALKKPCRCGKDWNSSVVWDDQLYFKKSPMVQVYSLGKFRGQEITKVVLRPYKFDENKGLSLYPDFKVSINKSTQIIKDDLFKKQANNNFLIVSHSSLMEGASQFAEYKREQGYTVKLVLYSDVASNSSELTSFFHGEYKNTAYEYAVIVGHEGLVPPHFVETSSSSQTPSDFPYFAMDGSEDVFPEVYYSRLVAKTNKELKRQLEKLKEYNDQSYADMSGFKNHIGIASNEGWDPSDVEYLTQMMEPLESAYALEPVRFHQDNSDSNAAKITEAFSEGSIFLNYIGHGIGDSWPSINSGEFHSNDLKNIEDGKVKPIVIDVACQNGRFSYDGRLGERLMNEKSRSGNPVGALAYYGGSVDISWDPPAIMAVAINRAIANKQAKGLFHAIMLGQKYLVENYDNPQSATENLRWYHLFGDPSLKLEL